MGAVFGRQSEEVGSVECGRAAFHAEARVAGKHTPESAFAGAVGPHYGMHFAGMYGKVESAQDFFAVDAGTQVFYF